jgi:enoyl-CoA hydratase
MKTATKIAAMSTPVTMMIKEAVNRSYEVTLSEGVRFERVMFQAAFGTEDQSEGMAAFVEKRKPVFKNR